MSLAGAPCAKLDAQNERSAKTALVALWLAVTRLRERLPEAAALSLGVLLRISMATTYNVVRGFDFNTHWPYLQYIALHGALPPFDLNAATYHPPLYYLIAAAIVRLGLGLARSAGWRRSSASADWLSSGSGSSGGSPSHGWRAWWRCLRPPCSRSACSSTGW